MKKHPTYKQSMIWSCICRNDTIIAEAGELYNDSVLELAIDLQNHPPNSGWVYIQTSNRLHGMKLHINELDPSELQSYTEATSWAFMVIYDPCVKQQQVQHFLQNIVHITEPYREKSSGSIPIWKNWNDTQETLSPILLRFMQEVTTRHLLISRLQSKKVSEQNWSSEKTKAPESESLEPKHYPSKNESLIESESPEPKHYHVRNESLDHGCSYSNGILHNNPWGFLQRVVSCGQWI